MLKRKCVWIQVEAEVYPSSLHSWLLSKEKVNENWNHSTWANLHLIWNIVVFFKKSLVQWCLAISHFPPAFTLNVSSDAFAIFSFQHWTRLGNIFSLLLKIIYLTCLMKPTSSQRSASISLCKRENQKDNQYQGTRLKINRKRCFIHLTFRYFIQTSPSQIAGKSCIYVLDLAHSSRKTERSYGTQLQHKTFTRFSNFQFAIGLLHPFCI